MLSHFLHTVLLILSTFALHIHALDIDSSIHSDHNHHRIDIDVHEVDWGLQEERQEPLHSSQHEHGSRSFWADGLADYQAEFPSWGPGSGRDIIGRAATGVTTLTNGATYNSNVNPGDVVNFVLESSQIADSTRTAYGGLLAGILGPSAQHFDKRSLVPEIADAEPDSSINEHSGNATSASQRRQTTDQSRTVYISINTCTQPSPNGDPSTGQPPAQLNLYVSTDSQNQSPGPGKGSNQIVQQLMQGYANVTVETSGDVFIGVSAPDGGDSAWAFEVAASTIYPAQYYNGATPFLWTLDTDSSGALLATFNLTDADELSNDEREAYLQLSTMPFTLFMYNRSDPTIDGLRNSYCGLSKALGNESVEMTSSMTTRGFGDVPKQQFHVTNLSSSHDFTAVLAYKTQNLSQVWHPVDLRTKSDGNCALVFDLPFCDTVAYAVPTNGTLSTRDLGQLYDNNTAAYYQNFDYSLQQVACNTTASAQYSLERNCTDCARDYKTWLCAVTIPRCADFSTPANDPANAVLSPRQVGSPYSNSTMVDLPAFGVDPSAVNNSWNAGSRVPLINSTINPGPYKEVLPCRELCYEIVKSCPASLGFSCPVQEALWNRSYAMLDTKALAGRGLTCNYPGRDWPNYVGAGNSLNVGTWIWGVWGVTWGVVLWGLT